MGIATLAGIRAGRPPIPFLAELLAEAAMPVTHTPARRRAGSITTIPAKVSVSFDAPLNPDGSRPITAAIVSAGRLPIVRLPGRRDKRGRGTTEGTRRVLYAIEDLQKTSQRIT